jgi:hypothetical protein
MNLHVCSKFYGTKYSIIFKSFSKIFEKVIYKRLVNHAFAYNILSKAQYGFRANMSTDNAIYQLTNNILKALDNKQFVERNVLCLV